MIIFSQITVKEESSRAKNSFFQTRFLLFGKHSVKNYTIIIEETLYPVV